MVQVLGFRVQVLEFRVQGLGFRVYPPPLEEKASVGFIPGIGRRPPSKLGS